MRLRARCCPACVAVGAAPVVGWAAFSAASLPILTLIGFSQAAVIGLAALGMIVAGAFTRDAPGAGRGGT